MKISTDYTDTLGGEPNYSWVARKELALPDGATLAQIKQTAKYENGLLGARGTWDGTLTSDVLEFRPRGRCAVLFVTIDE